MNWQDRKTSTVETTPSHYEIASTGSLDKPESEFGDRLEFVSVKKMSLIRAFSMATMLPIARLDEEILHSRGYGVVANSPYIALRDAYDDEEALLPILGFSVGAPRLIIPRRVTLTGATLRALAAGKPILNPIVLDFEE